MPELSRQYFSVQLDAGKVSHFALPEGDLVTLELVSLAGDRDAHVYLSLQDPNTSSAEKFVIARLSTESLECSKLLQMRLSEDFYLFSTAPVAVRGQDFSGAVEMKTLNLKAGVLPVQKTVAKPAAAQAEAPNAAPKKAAQKKTETKVPEDKKTEAKKASDVKVAKKITKADGKADKEKKEKKDAPKPEPTKKVLPGGVVSELLKAGRGGPAARKGQTVKVRYEGRLAKNGKRFDKGAIDFRLGRGDVIKGWDIGVAGLTVGEARRLLIPSKLAYGPRGAPPDIPPNSDLVFEVELLRAK